MNITNCTAYELRMKQELAELNSIGYLLEHKKTKAKIVVIEKDRKSTRLNSSHWS